MSTPSIKLNSEEVRAHLKHILGPDVSISGEHLRNFMHDLRKLIRKDQKQLLEDKENLENNSNNCNCNCHERKSFQYNDSSTTELSTSENDEIVSEEINVNDKPTLTVQKQTSSFILPWRIRPPRSAGPGRTGPPKNMKEDPVKLYQHYQDVWRQHRFPGETRHSGLRWSIREKMVGQDPQPRDNEKDEVQSCKCECCNQHVPVKRSVSSSQRATGNCLCCDGTSPSSCQLPVSRTSAYSHRL